MPFQPLQLIPEHSVEIKHIWRPDNKDIAWVQPKGQDYLITLNDAQIKKHYEESWVHDFVSLEYYSLGFLTHEVCHIRSESFSGVKSFDDGLFHYIDNVIDDSRIENSLWYDYPAHAGPLRWTLASIKPTLEGIKSSDEKTKSKVIALLQTLFRVTRFGVIDETVDDMNFVSFFLPYTLSAIVNERQNLLESCTPIYLWILEACDSDAELQKSLRSGKVVKVGIGDEEIEQVLEGQSVADSGIRELVEQVNDTAESKEKAKEIGQSDHDLTLEDKTNAFCRQTITKRAQEIQELHTIFRQTREGWDEARTRDDCGEIADLVEAYAGSFSDDEEPSFTEPRRIVPALTMWIVRDVSDSTCDDMNEYAEACVMLHAALTDIPLVRSAQIDFADSAKVVKLPDELLMESLLYPYTDGGTQIAKAMEILETADFGYAQKILCILTDGGFADRNKAKVLADRLIEEQNIDEVLVIYLTGYEHDLSGNREILGRRAYYCKIEEITEVLYQTVVRLRERY